MLTPSVKNEKGEKAMINKKPGLPYPMGNTGDIIKHGLLAEFVEWWYKDMGRDTLYFADVFCGRPWCDTENKTLYGRLRSEYFCDTALGRAQNNNGRYYGSSHLVRLAAERCERSVVIHSSDNCNDKRQEFARSIKDYSDFMRMKCDLPENDGYKILDGVRDAKYKLILLDPYSEFLECEYMRDKCLENQRGKRLDEILKLVKKRDDLFVALFVLEPNDRPEIREWYCNYKKREMPGQAFYMRCPNTKKKSLWSQSKYQAEILLIGQKVSDKKLCERLMAFTEIVKSSLSGKNQSEVAGGLITGD